LNSSFMLGLGLPEKRFREVYQRDSGSGQSKRVNWRTL